MYHSLHSALAKAGKSVLLVDQEDTYGSQYASFTLEALTQAAKGVVRPSLTAESEGDRTPGLDGSRGEAEGPATSAPRDAQQEDRRFVHLRPFRMPLHGVESCGLQSAEPSADLGDKASRLHILDLMPKAGFYCLVK